MKARPQPAKRKRLGYVYDWIPSRWSEYAYYFVVFYSFAGFYLGIELPFVATGIMAALVGFFVFQQGSRAKQAYVPIKLLLACAISFLIIQIVFHSEPVIALAHRNFVNWSLGLIIVYSLCRRQGFLHRFTILLFVLGLITVPYLAVKEDGGAGQSFVDLPIGGNLANPNGLAEWFGFCTVYFAIYGIETMRGVIVRIGSWLIAIGCLFIVALTVSRGGLLATAIAITVGFRRSLKRGFVPVLLLIVLAGVIWQIGLFEQATSRYEQRGAEETGRGLLWPLVIDRILQSPIVGVGVSRIATYIPEISTSITVPHNSFFYFGLSSGIVPLALYVAFWIQAAQRSMRHSERMEDGAFRLPFLIFTFVAVMVGDLGFMSPWALLALSIGAGSAIFHQPHDFLLLRSARGVRIRRPIGRRHKATNSAAHS